jgi:hypothetical protein
VPGGRVRVLPDEQDLDGVEGHPQCREDPVPGRQESGPAARSARRKSPIARSRGSAGTSTDPHPGPTSSVRGAGGLTGHPSDRSASGPAHPRLPSTPATASTARVAASRPCSTTRWSSRTSSGSSKARSSPSRRTRPAPGRPARPAGCGRARRPPPGPGPAAAPRRSPPTPGVSSSTGDIPSGARASSQVPRSRSVAVSSSSAGGGAAGGKGAHGSTTCAERIRARSTRRPSSSMPVATSSTSRARPTTSRGRTGRRTASIATDSNVRQRPSRVRRAARRPARPPPRGRVRAPAGRRRRAPPCGSPDPVDRVLGQPRQRRDHRGAVEAVEVPDRLCHVVRGGGP